MKIVPPLNSVTVLDPNRASSAFGHTGTVIDPDNVPLAPDAGPERFERVSRTTPEFQYTLAGIE